MYYRILHISDFHWSQKSANDQNIVVQALVEDLKGLLEERAVNRIVFTGDLVQAGSNAADFEAAKAALFDPICSATGIDVSEIIICAGNHDIDRNLAKEDNYLESGLSSTLISRDELNEHIDKFLPLDISRDHALARMHNYNDFASRNFGFHKSKTNNYFNIVKDSPQSIGYAIFNTAWRSSGDGEKEKGKLLLGERIVDTAAKELDGCRTKIAVMHHPLDWLPTWDARAVSVPLFEHFHIVLFGHVHDDWPVSQKNPIGECILAQCGCLYESRDYYNGYQIIDIGTKTDEFCFSLRRFYDQPRRKFGPNEAVAPNGRKEYSFDVDGSRKSLSVKQLTALRAAIDRAADRHVAAFQNEGGSFDTVYEPPILSSKCEQECLSLEPKEARKTQVSLSDILTRNGVQIIYGARETGKTTLLYKIAKEAFNLSAMSYRIPIYVDFKKISKYDNIEKIVRSSINRYNVEIELPANAILNHHSCVFLLDNLNASDTSKLEAIKALVISEKGKKHDWLMFVDDSANLTEDSLSKLFPQKNKNAYIHTLNRTQARSLISRITPSGVSAQAQEIVLKLIQDNNLPRSTYIISVLSFLFVNKSINIVINEANLVDKMIDILLQKADKNGIMRSSKDFTGLNIILQNTAAWINESEIPLDENTFIAKLAGFLNGRGILTGTAEFYNTLLRSGVLECVDGEISFRYRAFEAFFHANHIKETSSINDTIFNPHGIIRYSKEYSFICDMSRQDATILTGLEEFIESLEPDKLKNFDGDTFIEIAVKTRGDDQIRIDSLLPQPKTTDEQDQATELAERAANRLKQLFDEIKGAKDKPPTTRIGDFDIPTEILDYFAFLQAFSVWGRAISSLDYVELSMRKPSLFKLLSTWGRLSSWLAIAANETIAEYREESKKEGKEIPAHVENFLKKITRLYMPLRILYASFEHIGCESVSQLFIEAYDACDQQSLEAIGLACLLITQRPEGWARRLQKFVGELKKLKGPDRPKSAAKIEIIMEVLMTEYMWKNMSEDNRKRVKELILICLEAVSDKSIIATKFEAEIRKIDLQREQIAKDLGN